MVWLMNSQRMKNCKSTESFCLNILTIYTNDWPTYILVTATIFIFSARFLNMCKPRATFSLFWRAGPPELAFVEVSQHAYQVGLGGWM